MLTPSPPDLKARTDSNLPREQRGRGVTAVLGPTNTGKTFYAIERMVAHSSGLIGLPLRLLAREVYEKICARVGEGQVALITGEERIRPPKARYWVATVEAMPRDLDVSFLAIDEVQLAADLERGHVFTDRILNLRGRDETLLLGAASMQPILEKLIPGISFMDRPRLSHLAYAGSKKITRLPRRSAVVAFAAEDVYTIAELIRRQRGGAAVVLGALSPRTRNAQVELYQSGEVDYLVATDAIGMGLNLDVDHVAFAGSRKFDGFQFRHLNLAEMGQIAGRAGRHLRDGTFGVTGRVNPLDDETVKRLEAHDYPRVQVLQWRNRELDFSSLNDLRASLAEIPQEQGLTRAPDGEDIAVIDTARRDPDIRDMARNREAVERLWDVSLLPDYRRIAPAQHADLVLTLYRFLMREGRIPEDWIAAQIKVCDRTDGDIDALSARIAHIRTWTFVANRPDWLDDPLGWQENTRALEDRLSDALHERLTQRFVDRRTSQLARRLREKTLLDAQIDDKGAVTVEGHHVGTLTGFRFSPDTATDPNEAKALAAAAAKVLPTEIQRRADLVCAATTEAFALNGALEIVWREAPIARLTAGKDWLSPQLMILADEHLAPQARENVESRLGKFVTYTLQEQLKPLFDLQSDESLPPAARGVAFRIIEGLGILERVPVASEIKALGQDERALMRKHGIRFGAFHIFIPALLKPAPRLLAAQLWALEGGGATGTSPQELRDEHVPKLVASGRTSVERDPAIPDEVYRALGFKVVGKRAVRLDILERVGDVIRGYMAWRPLAETPKPEGAVDGQCFMVTPELTSLLGSSFEEVAAILQALGFRKETRPIPAPAESPEIPASTEPAASSESAAGNESGASHEPAESSEVAQASTSASEQVASEQQDARIETGKAETPRNATTEATADAAVADDQISATDASDTDQSAAPVADTSDATSENPADASAQGEQGEAIATADGSPESPVLPQAAQTDDVQPDDAPAEPATIEVWRPGRPGGQRGAGQKNQRRQDGPRRGRSEAKGTDGKGADGGKGDARNKGKGRPKRDRKDGNQEPRQWSGRPPRKEKTADPDSPFAQLADLKKSLERGS
jgi:ATP-dependent RNA helicase SUPV3L1/SUV3